MNFRGWLTLSVFSVLPNLSMAQTREVLFDGKTLTGWHIQGPGLWSVDSGRIHALNPTKEWGHLVTNKIYKNGYVRLKFLSKLGNSGLYVRGTQGSDFGVKGIQIDFGSDFGTRQDGAAMLVTDHAYSWYELTTKAADSGYVKTNTWNVLVVDMQGSSLKTYINGHLIWSSNVVAGMDTTGILALQLHAGGGGNDIYFKDIEVLMPTRVPYCPIPNDQAFRQGNDPDSTLCKGPVGIRIVNRPKVTKSKTDKFFNMQGRRLPTAPSKISQRKIP
jgi:hypothetical protein